MRYQGSSARRQKVLDQAVLEALEDRRMMSASISLASGVLTVQGESLLNNTMSVKYNADKTKLIASTNGNFSLSQEFLIDQVKSIHMIGGSGDDTMAVASDVNIPAHMEGLAGNDYMTGGAGLNTIDGGDGNDVLFGSNAGDVLIGGSGINQVNAYGVNALPVSSSTSIATKPTPAITLLSPGNLTGQVINANGITSVLGSGSALNARYDWDFGDPNGRYNTLEGFNAGHIYNTPGTYTITLRVTNEAGLSAVTTQKVTIAQAVRTTYYVSPNGNDANDGLTPQTAWQTLLKTQTVLNSTLAAKNSNVEILFEKGGVYTHGNAQGVTISGHNVVISSYGTGAAPVIFFTGTNSGTTAFTLQYNAANVRIDGLAFDSANTYNEDKAGTAYSIRPDGTNIAIQNCTFNRVLYAIDATPAPDGLYVVDNNAPLATGIRGYFVWLQGSNAVILGNKVANSTREHIIRGDIENALIAGNDFSNIDRTNTQALAQGTANGTQTTTTLQDTRLNLQANALKNYILRIVSGTGAGQSKTISANTADTFTVSSAWTTAPDATSVYAVYDQQDTSKATLTLRGGHYWRIANNEFRSGGVAFGPCAGSDVFAAIAAGTMTFDSVNQRAVEWVVVENNHNYNAATFGASAGTHHLVFRNNIAEVHNSRAFSVLASRTDTLTWIIQDISILNNTVISDSDDTDFLYMTGHAAGQIRVENNLFIAPRLLTGTKNGSPIWVNDDTDLSSFSSISNNVWPVPANIISRASGGIMFIKSVANTTASNYLTPSEWNQLTQVHGDVFRATSLSLGTQVSLGGGLIAGANLSQTTSGGTTSDGTITTSDGIVMPGTTTTTTTTNNTTWTNTNGSWSGTVPTTTTTASTTTLAAEPTVIAPAPTTETAPATTTPTTPVAETTTTATVETTTTSTPAATTETTATAPVTETPAPGTPTAETTPVTEPVVAPVETPATTPTTVTQPETAPIIETTTPAVVTPVTTTPEVVAPGTSTSVTSDPVTQTTTTPVTTEATTPTPGTADSTLGGTVWPLPTTPTTTPTTITVVITPITPTLSPTEARAADEWNSRLRKIRIKTSGHWSILSNLASAA